MFNDLCQKLLSLKWFAFFQENIKQFVGSLVPLLQIFNGFCSEIFLSSHGSKLKRDLFFQNYALLQNWETMDHGNLNSMTFVIMQLYISTDSTQTQIIQFRSVIWQKKFDLGCHRFKATIHHISTSVQRYLYSFTQLYLWRLWHLINTQTCNLIFLWQQNVEKYYSVTSGLFPL